MDLEGRTNASEKKINIADKIDSGLLFFFDNTILVARDSRTTIKATWNPRKKFVLVIAEPFELEKNRLFRERETFYFPKQSKLVFALPFSIRKVYFLLVSVV